MARVDFGKGWSKPHRFTGGKDNLNVISKWSCQGKSGIYLISEESDSEVLYVGKANSIDTRLQDHMRGEGDGNSRIAADVINGRTFTLRWVLSRDPELSESIAIVVLTPKYNGRCEWKRGIDKVDLFSCLREAERIGLIESKERVEESFIFNLCNALDIRITQVRQSKSELCTQAEALNKSTNWKEAEEALKKLQAEWKKLGFTGKDFDDAIWIRFKNAIDMFYQRRREYFALREKEWEENKHKKENICKEAESLASSTDWKKTGEAFKVLFERFKAIGSAGREHNEKLWNRFIEAKAKFNERRNEYFNRQKQEQTENLGRKWKIISQVEALSGIGTRVAGDLQDSVRRVKELQAEWKTIGYVPRDQLEEVNNRFRQACNNVFDWARQERERSQAEWRNRMKEVIVRKKEQADRLRDSIHHDEQVIAQKWDKISNLRPGGRAAEIRSHLEEQIRSIQQKIDSKSEKVRDLESAARDLEIKIYGF